MTSMTKTHHPKNIVTSLATMLLIAVMGIYFIHFWQHHEPKIPILQPHQPLAGIDCVINLALADLYVGFSNACADTENIAVEINDVILGGQPQEVIITMKKNELSTTTLTVYYNQSIVHQIHSTLLDLKQAQSFSGKYLALSFHPGAGISGDGYIVLDQNGTIVHQLAFSPRHVVLMNTAGIKYRIYEADSSLNCTTADQKAIYYTAYQVTFTADDTISVDQQSIVTIGEFCQQN
jgi:hypothetical protein